MVKYSTLPRNDCDRRDRPPVDSPCRRREDRPGAWSPVSPSGGSPPPFRSATLPDRSKRYRALSKKAPADPVPLAEAIRQLKAFDTTKFNQTVEVSTNLGIDPRQSDQNVR